ncbi:hypothetical protein Cseg_2613 [Caulobacter segnis ATCC 21756]|uniref:Uncharacterized protein n=2 Tax=Caulobacter segnis TaxID=88688 RepID=D5VKP1_CAUST|nr:hypothetical protein Cseg_2613 [Caulobacter segnis ATCC 21756]
MRIKTFLGHYDIRFYLSPGAYVDVGAGSLACIQNIKLVPSGEVGKLGEIGRFCEMHASAFIQMRGEHANDQPVNISFTGMPILDGVFENQGLEVLTPFSIGSGVVLSAYAQVLSGRTVGDGVVLGASAVLTRDAEALGVYAGVPARKLRSRRPFARWWDFDIAYLMANKERLQEIAADDARPHVYRQLRPRFVLRNEGNSITIQGFLDGDAVRPIDQAPPAVHSYIAQAFGATSSYWLADCWALA